MSHLGVDCARPNPLQTTANHGRGTVGAEGAAAQVIDNRWSHTDCKYLAILP